MLLLGAVVAGLLTAASPCVLPVLPVVLGSALLPAAGSTGLSAAPGARVGRSGSLEVIPVMTAPGARSAECAGSRLRLLVLTASLGLSVIAFTLLLRATTLLLPVPRMTWSILSGGLLAVLGLTQLLPGWWERSAAILRLSAAHRLLPRSRSMTGVRSAALTGAALGPVFSSCSPLYAYVVATVLPASALWGLALLLSYTAGLCGTLLAVALAGRRAVRGLRWAADPRGSARRVAGLLLLVVGVAILLGADRTVETWAVQNLPLMGVWTFDAQFLPHR